MADRDKEQSGIGPVRAALLAAAALLFLSVVAAFAGTKLVLFLSSVTVMPSALAPAAKAKGPYALLPHTVFNR